MDYVCTLYYLPLNKEAEESVPYHSIWTLTKVWPESVTIHLIEVGEVLNLSRNRQKSITI